MADEVNQPRGATVFVVNPASAAGATLRRFERLRGTIKSRLGDFEVRLTERAGHATELVRDALRGGARCIVAVGGDGTNHEVVNGFFDENGAPLGEAATFGVLTSGTGGDFRKTFGWSDDADEAIERIARGQTRKIDVGRVQVTTAAGPHTRCFLNIASFGLSGAVDDVVNKGSKRLGGKASFFVGTVQAFLGYTPPTVRLCLDEGPAFEERISVVAVANGQFFGGGMWIAPDADVSDGRFTVVRVLDAGKRFWVQHATKVYSGKHTHLDAVKVSSARVVTAEPVSLGAPVLLDLDGEQIGQLPARFEILPHALALLV